MARPRETDVRNFPEQAERFRRAMWWARVSSAAELAERMGGKMKPSTVNNRIQGNAELRPIEVESFAAALGVSADVLVKDGPMLPDPAEAHVHAVLTGEPGSWTITTIAPGASPQAVYFTTDDPPGLAELLTAGSPPSDSRLPTDSNQPTTERSSAGQGRKAAGS